jgi:hypothetical protein
MHLDDKRELERKICLMQRDVRRWQLTSAGLAVFITTFLAIAFI